MVVTLLAVLAATTVTGMALYAVEEGKGPLSAVFSADLPEPVTGNAAPHARERQEIEAERVWEEVHEVFANLALVLVLLHIAGVAAASFSHRENLVRSMVDGKKRPL